MSTYLLLRNNKETGPFTIEEMKDMSLKTFDLVWAVGKSAAWRYPGEIPEFRSFAPEVPVQEPGSHIKKLNPEGKPADPAYTKRFDTGNSNARENNSTKASPGKSVYVNLPAEKKPAAVSAAGILYDSSLDSHRDDESDFTDRHTIRQSRAVRISGKILWVSSILLLFGTGILTGFFISDRRKYFSSNGEHPQILPAVSPGGRIQAKEILPDLKPAGPNVRPTENSARRDSLFSTDAALSGKSVPGTGKKNKKTLVNKDSVAGPLPADASARLLDSSVQQRTVNQTEILSQKVKAHPENYIDVVTGKYTKGIFGGISSLPITVTNHSPVLMEMVEVSIDYVQNNDKIYKTENIPFNDLEPGESVTIKAPKSARGTRINLRIHRINSHALDLNYSN